MELQTEWGYLVRWEKKKALLFLYEGMRYKRVKATCWQESILSTAVLHDYVISGSFPHEVLAETNLEDQHTEWENWAQHRILKLL